MDIDRAEDLLRECEPLHAFCGVGSRDTPQEILNVMYLLGIYMGQEGYALWSGGCPGPDKTFEFGHGLSVSPKTIFLPREGFAGQTSGLGDYIRVPPYSKRSESLARTVWNDLAEREGVARWGRLTAPTREYHIRNTACFCDLDEMVCADLVICWTEDGAETHEDRTISTGGTGQIISLASLAGIPVKNLAREDRLAEERAWMEEQDPFTHRAYL